MHYTAMTNGRRFFETYLAGQPSPRIGDIGAQDVNGSLRSVAPKGAQYIGVDFAAGRGVDVVIDDPYKLPFEADHFDAIVSSSCFEHSEFFWLTFLEVMRVLKPAGLFYMNAPSNGHFHRHPVDCWRFYPDSGVALARWGQRNGYKTAVLESYTSEKRGTEVWADFVCVFVKDEAHVGQHPNRILSKLKEFSNGLVHPALDKFIRYAREPEDIRARPGRK